MILEINNAEKLFTGPSGEVRAVDGISLSLEAGEFVSVRGASGCGKTTALLMAGGLLRPTSGTITINAREPYSMSPNERAAFRAKHVGFVFQQFHLIPYLNVRDNILAASLAAHLPDAKNKTMKLVEQFSLTDRIQHVPSELSTGERQRTALARAFLNEPLLILADEPTGNLDDKSAESVLSALSGFAQAGGAVLLVTHDARAASYASRSLHMTNGKIKD